MVTIEETIEEIVTAPSWDRRVAAVRLVAQRHGTGDHQRIYAAVARQAYVPYLAPDFAYINSSEFYEPETFHAAYEAADRLTNGFTGTDAANLTATLQIEPRTLLVFRTIVGLTKQEFAQATQLLLSEGTTFSASKVDAMEKRGTPPNFLIAASIAATLTKIMDGTLFGEPPGELRSKQEKIDTERGWESVRDLAENRVPYADFLHQRHYGGAFRQILDATSTRRGNLIEDAVEDLFRQAGVSYIRTGSHDQGEIAHRFEIQVQPVPDFVVYDESGTLRALLECKLVNDGGTARDKALRFERLRAEANRLGGVPLFAVLSGMGWSRVNDTLGPVVRDTDGRVFTLSNLPEMLEVSPFPAVRNTATT